jgi:hypothetical protein
MLYHQTEQNRSSIISSQPGCLFAKAVELGRRVRVTKEHAGQIFGDNQMTPVSAPTHVPPVPPSKLLESYFKVGWTWCSHSRLGVLLKEQARSVGLLGFPSNTHPLNSLHDQNYLSEILDGWDIARRSRLDIKWPETHTTVGSFTVSNSDHGPFIGLGKTGENHIGIYAFEGFGLSSNGDSKLPNKYGLWFIESGSNEWILLKQIQNGDQMNSTLSLFGVGRKRNLILITIWKLRMGRAVDFRGITFGSKSHRRFRRSEPDSGIDKYEQWELINLMPNWQYVFISFPWTECKKSWTITMTRGNSMLHSLSWEFQRNVIKKLTTMWTAKWQTCIEFVVQFQFHNLTLKVLKTPWYRIREQSGKSRVNDSNSGDPDR